MGSLFRRDDEFVSGHSNFKGEEGHQEKFQENVLNQTLLMFLWDSGEIFGLKVNY